MHRNVQFAFLAALLFSIFAAPAFADNRIALVIGNGSYARAPYLPNPLHDAEDVAAALKRSGFEIIVGTDLDKAGMDDAVIKFARAARTADVAMFYYSGHALQFGGINYLVPVDARLSDEADLLRMVRVDDVIADMQPAKNLRILVLDSCRDNPFVEQLRRSVGAARSASVGRHQPERQEILVSSSTPPCSGDCILSSVELHGRAKAVCSCNSSRGARTPLRVISAILSISCSLPAPEQRTSSGRLGMSQKCH